MSAQGRGPDSTLVHMSPRELSGLQSLAMAHGGTLTINPETGLPEAGFLDSILPTLLGGAATFFSGGTITPFMAALGVGGLTALTSKDLGKGLMAGLGAYGGAGIAGGLMNFGEAAIGAEAARGALPAGVDKFGADAIAFEPTQLAAEKAARAGATNFDRLSRGVTEGFKNPMGAFSAIGGGSKLQGAAMLGAPLLSALSTQDQTSVPTAEQIKFDPRYANINISRQQLPYQPDTGGSKERRYFGNTYVTQYADGGAVANDGIQHFAYGGGTIDPTYDYSGYGDRSKSSVMKPITHTEAPKPDFVAADGKTYRYDPVKKSWYVIKEAEAAKTNPGAETLVGGGGNDVVKNTNPFNPITNNGFFSSILGRTTQTAAPVVEKSTYSPLAQIQQNQIQRQQEDDAAMQAQADREARDAQAARDAEAGKYTGLSGLQARQAEMDADAQEKDKAIIDAFDKQTHIDLTNIYENALQAANAQAQAEAEAQAQRDAVTSVNSPTATGGKANSPSGIAALGVNLDAGELSNREPVTTTLSDRISALANNARASQAARAAADAEAIGDMGFNDVNTGNTGTNTNTGQTGMNTGTTGGSPAQAGDIGNPGGVGNGYDGGYSGGYDGGDPGGNGARAKGGMIGRYAQGGLGSLGGYSDGGRLLRGPGDGVSDSIPATVGDRQPARLADGEFVVPARIVSELGNGSTEAGARALYKMMDRIQANRRKTTGKNSVAVNSKSHKYLPA